jgi:hypothetical protein
MTDASANQGRKAFTFGEGAGTAGEVDRFA